MACLSKTRGGEVTIAAGMEKPEGVCWRVPGQPPAQSHPVHAGTHGRQGQRSARLGKPLGGEPLGRRGEAQDSAVWLL